MNIGSFSASFWEILNFDSRREIAITRSMLTRKKIYCTNLNTTDKMCPLVLLPPVIPECTSEGKRGLVWRGLHDKNMEFIKNQWKALTWYKINKDRYFALFRDPLTKGDLRCRRWQGVKGQIKKTREPHEKCRIKRYPWGRFFIRYKVQGSVSGLPGP